VDLVFYLKDGTDYYTANSITDKIRQIPGVKNVEYISKEQALSIISKTYPETAEFLLKFNLKNPLPASVSVTTESAEQQRDVLNSVAKSPYAQYIENNRQQNRVDNQNIIASTAENLININNFVKQLIFWVVFIFIIGGALIVINAIQLTIFTRRNEIFIMRLVGATPNFIRLPFLTEGVCYAVIAVILSFVLLYVTGQALDLESVQILKELGQLNLTNVFLVEVALCALLALISSLATVEKYIKGSLSYN
jgi:cell division transport system permease protein